MGLFTYICWSLWRLHTGLLNMSSIGEFASLTNMGLLLQVHQIQIRTVQCTVHLLLAVLCKMCGPRVLLYVGAKVTSDLQYGRGFLFFFFKFEEFLVLFTACQLWRSHSYIYYLDGCLAVEQLIEGKGLN